MDAPCVYLNGKIVPRGEAAIDVEDRGMLFADGVYEVLSYYRGKPLGLREHTERLRRSLAAVLMPVPAELDQLGAITDELLKRTNLRDAKAYWQITRGTAPRDHTFPAKPTPTVLVIVYPTVHPDPALPPRAIACITHEDQRWTQCWIKSLMLLPNVMAKNVALGKGAQEAILVRDGRVTEGTSTNVFMVKNGELYTHPANQWILGGVTRNIIIEEARAAGIKVNETALPAAGLAAYVDELLISGTTTHISAVTSLDQQRIGSGSVGPVTQRLHECLMARIAKL